MLSTARTNDADPRIGINTSDHTYQATRVILVDAQDEPLAVIQGCTWNLMNYGISLKTNGSHPNNPWDFDEDHVAYLSRKKRQLDKVISIIQRSSATEIKDFFLLQEVDIFFPANVKLKISVQQQIDRDLLKTQFENTLRELGWELILQNGSAKQQALVILYNKNNLQLLGASYGVFPTATQQCRGLAQEFMHLASQQIVTLVNLHLDYESDYSNIIPDFQRQQIRLGKFTIMGGDTNHAPNQEIVGLINNWNNITNLASETIGISHRHKNLPHILKCYDGFFANPTQTTAVHITEQAAEVFKVDASGNYVVEALPANPHVHRSAPGEPWRRGGYRDYLQNNREARAGSVSSVALVSLNDKQATFFAPPTPTKSSAVAESFSSPQDDKDERQAHIKGVKY